MKQYNEYVIYDIETDGIDREQSSILSISALHVKNNEIVNEFDTFVKYENEVPELITELTGITTADVSGDHLPSQDEAIDQLITFINDLPVGGFNNLSFDDSFVERNGKVLTTNDRFDVYQYVQMYNPFVTENLKLESFAKVLNCEQSHQSLNDCYLTFDLLTHLIKEYNEIGEEFGDVVKSWDDILTDTIYSANNNLKLYVGSRVTITEYNTFDVKNAHKYHVTSKSPNGKRHYSMFTDKIETIKLLKNEI